MVLAILTSFVIPLPLPFEGRLIRAVETAFHFPLFFAGFWAIASALRSPIRWHRVALLVAASAIGVELVQAATHRDPDAVDAVLSTMGGWAGLLALAGQRMRGRWAMFGARLAATLLAAGAGWPVLQVLADRVHARYSFPVLGSFEGRSEPGRWWSHACRIARVPQHATEGQHALRAVVERAGRGYPGLFMTDGIGDWSGYDVLQFDIFLAGTDTRSLWVRADDRADYPPYNDRAQTLLSLAPGMNHVSLSLHELLVTPGGRALDRSRLARWGFFFDAGLPGDTIFVDRIRLTP